jgi:hypothetical protein
MSKTILNVPFGKGFRILKDGNLVDRATLAKRYPLIAAAKPEEILVAIERLSMRQVENQLREYVKAGNRVGVAYVPPLSKFMTTVDDSVNEDDLDPVDEENELDDENDDEPTPAPVQHAEKKPVSMDEAEDDIKDLISDVKLPSDLADPVVDIEAEGVEIAAGMDEAGLEEISDTEVDREFGIEPDPLGDAATALGASIMGISVEDIVADAEVEDEPAANPIADAIAARDAEAEKVKYPCDHPGCNEEFDTPRGLAIHKTRSHSVDEDAQIEEEYNDIFNEDAVKPEQEQESVVETETEDLDPVMGLLEGAGDLSDDDAFLADLGL